MAQNFQTGVVNHGFNGVTPIARPAAITAASVASGSMTFTAPGTPDYAFADVVSGGYGCSTADEMRSLLKVVQNSLVRIEEIYSKLQALGLIT